MLARGCAPRVPALGSVWLWRWRKSYNVSLRKPNRRYKVSRQGLIVRLRIFWLNNIRVRHFCQRVFGHDPGRHVDNADQKGWFMNSAGAKGRATLEIEGAPEVPLVENHAATRHRLSLMTFTTNNLAAFEEGPPLEICFRVEGSGSTILDGLRLPPGPFSVRASSSGSYKEEHVYSYLEEHLPPASDARRAANDWRLFYLDIYAGHLSRRIWDLCWSRMYILLYHGGGCTGLTQPNDLWLHLALEKGMEDMEASAFLRHQLLRPDRVPSLSRQEVLDNACQVWLHGIDHSRSIRWTQRAGMSIALDGSEDDQSHKVFARACPCVRVCCVFICPCACVLVCL